jgi:hypothetical protein
MFKCRMTSRWGARLQGRHLARLGARLSRALALQELLHNVKRSKGIADDHDVEEVLPEPG